MKRLLFLILLILLTIRFTGHAQDGFYKNNLFQLSISEEGYLYGLMELENMNEFLSSDSVSPLLSLQVNGTILHPVSAKFNNRKRDIILTFPGRINATVRAEQKPTHITFELVSVSDPERIELAIWGPYAIILNEVIGETIGVVSGKGFTVGIQALNPKTLGGYPWKENDCMPQIDIFDQDDLSDLSEQGKRYVLYRVEAAKPASFGSTLQAYCRNRAKERIVENWGFESYISPAFDDGGVVGSKITLFCCPSYESLKTIETIEVAEGLPHPVIDGRWGKVSPGASAAYLIMNFGEENLDSALNLTKQAGLRYLYHPDPFDTWGHFDLKATQFPEGTKSMKRCVDRAREQGVMLGVHVLSNFITTNDPYVTPVPDTRLAKAGSSQLAADIDSIQTGIRVESPAFFCHTTNDNLKSAVIGEEIIRYGSVEETESVKLLDCQRGVFGTRKQAHAKGDTIAKLADHAYKVFLTNPELSIEVATNLANLFNETGLRQISFDGLEGNRSTGMGNYGEILFTNTWYTHLDESIKKHFIADASRTSHYFWHIYSRMNWGEPWYAGFRESQTDYRLHNQAYFKRNLMPGMLGWFKMTSETSVEDIEWMLARSVAFDAGYAFCTNFHVVEENGQSDIILKMLGEWERARMAKAFSPDQKKLMEDIANEFHLEQTGANSWDLYRIHSFKFIHENREHQPGEHGSSTFAFTNPEEQQPIGFIITAKDVTLSHIELEIDHYKSILLPITLLPGKHLKYVPGGKAMVFTNSWIVKEEISVEELLITVGEGKHSITVDCNFETPEKGSIKLEIRISSQAESLPVIDHD